MNHHPFQPARMIPAAFRCRPLLAALAILGLIVHASAQVTYVQEILPTGPLSTLVVATQAPYETGDPTFSAQPTSYLVFTNSFFVIDPVTGTFGGEVAFSSDVKAGPTSLVTLSGLNTAATFADIYNSRNQLLTYGISDATLMAIRPLIEVPENYYSLAARSRARDLVSFITDQQHYTLSKSTGEMTAFSLSGVDMDEAFYQSYGQDGLLYVLDYGNDRIASFDPDSAFAPVSSFSLNTGVTTANVQFAIGITGSVYLADGLGGGSYYDSTGAFQGTFSLPGGTVGAPYEGASYVSTDSAGRVYIFDSATGFHQYDDVAVPEPGTALAGLALIGLVGAARRRRAF